MKLFRFKRSVESGKSVDFPASLDPFKLGEYRDVVTAMDAIDEKDSKKQEKQLADKKAEEANSNLAVARYRFETSDPGLKLRLATLENDRARNNVQYANEQKSLQLNREHELETLRLSNERLVLEQAANRRFELDQTKLGHELTLKVVAVVSAFVFGIALVYFAYRMIRKYRKVEPPQIKRAEVELQPVTVAPVAIAPIASVAAVSPAPTKMLPPKVII